MTIVIGLVVTLVCMLGGFAAMGGQLSEGLPALGIVAAVLGVIKAMGALDQSPEVLGHLIGAALVGTFAGIFFPRKTYAAVRCDQADAVDLHEWCNAADRH